jgi:hypothetical protein
MVLTRTGVVILACASFAGCASKNENLASLVPVSGKVTVSGKPLTAGTITFTPEEAAGLNARYSPTSKIGPDGTYTITTGGVPGALPGKYRVVVSTAPSPMAAPDTRAPKQPAISSKYKTAQSTDLSVDVSPTSPGPYYLKLTP